MDTHSFGQKKYQKKGQKTVKKGKKSCQEYQWYINYWPPCPGFGPKHGQKGTKKKTFDTQDSRVVPHRSTDWAQPCLTSQFGWDTVYPQWYDRMMRCIILSSILLCTDQRTVMKPMFQLSHYEQVRVGVVGNISACHADAPGSIPGHGVCNFFSRRRGFLLS